VVALVCSGSSCFIWFSLAVVVFLGCVASLTAPCLVLFCLGGEVYLVLSTLHLYSFSSFAGLVLLVLALLNLFGCLKQKYLLH